MFRNPGEKIKNLAWFVFVLLLIVNIFLALGAWAESESVILGVVVLIVGILVAWLSTVFVYAFGALVDDTQRSREMLEALISSGIFKQR